MPSRTKPVLPARTTDVSHDTSRESAAPERTPDQDLVHRLKTAIDQRGRYAFRLDDMAHGYAAGQGVSFTEARKVIEMRFEQEFGRTPHAYLDRPLRRAPRVRRKCRARARQSSHPRKWNRER